MTLESDGETKCYQIAPGPRLLFLLATILCFVMGAILAHVLSIANAGKAEGVALALFYGGCWLVLTLKSLYMLVYYYRYRLWLTTSYLRMRGFSSDYVLPLRNIKEVRWGIHGACGKVELRGLFGTLPIEFGKFTAWDRAELVDYFRAAVHPLYQFNRDKFDFRYFPDPQVAEARHHLYLRIAIGCLSVGLGCLIAAFVTSSGDLLVAAALLLLFGVAFWFDSLRAPVPFILAELADPPKSNAS
jgi:hypothetical protein